MIRRLNGAATHGVGLGGLAPVRLFEGGLWSYVDRQLKEVIPARFRKALWAVAPQVDARLPLRYGQAEATIGDTMGYVNAQ